MMEIIKSVNHNLVKALSSKYICKLISIVLAITLFTFVSSIGESGYALADTFGCYENCPNPNPPTLRKELKNSQECKEINDYIITSKSKGSQVTVLSIHGGLIEASTSEISRDLSHRYGWNHYDFYGEIKAQKCAILAKLEKQNIHYDVLHITSTNFDEPRAVDLVRSHKNAVAIHGYDRKEKKNNIQTICVGGKNSAQVSKFIQYLKDKEPDQLKDLLGYSLNPVNVPLDNDSNPINVPEENTICLKNGKQRALTGTDGKNIVNRTMNPDDGGLQIELNKKIRKDLAEGIDKPDSSSPDQYQLLRNVIYRAINYAMLDTEN